MLYTCSQCNVTRPLFWLPLSWLHRPDYHTVLSDNYIQTRMVDPSAQIKLKRLTRHDASLWCVYVQPSHVHNLCYRNYFMLIKGGFGTRTRQHHARLWGATRASYMSWEISEWIYTYTCARLQIHVHTHTHTHTDTYANIQAYGTT